MFDVENTIIEMNSENNDLRFDRFKAALNESIQIYAPTKKQCLNKPNAFHERNQRSHEETTSQKLMFKHKFDVDRKTYNKHRNPCVSLIRSEKKNFFSNIITIDIKDKKNLLEGSKTFCYL